MKNKITNGNSVYFVGYLLDGATREVVSNDAAFLEKSFSARNPLERCHAHITLKEPFEVETSLELRLFDTIFEQVKHAKNLPLLHPEKLEYLKSSNAGHHLVIEYSDLLAKEEWNVNQFRKSLNAAIELLVPGSEDFKDRTRPIHTSLGLLFGHLEVAQFSIKLSDYPSPLKIQEIALFKRQDREQTKWDIIHRIPLDIS